MSSSCLQVTKDLGMVTKSLDQAMAAMDLGAVRASTPHPRSHPQMSAVMDKFERQAWLDSDFLVLTFAV